MAPVGTSAVKNFQLPLFWIIGGPGTGKGTVCKELVPKYGFTHVSTGDLLREEIATGSARSREAAEIMAKGGLVPTEFVLLLLTEKFEKELPHSKGFLIDGYPRDKTQGELFEERIAPVDGIVYLEADDETMIERLVKRGRPGETREVIAERIAVFHANNGPILKEYANKIKTVNAVQTREAVLADVVIAIDYFLSKK